MTTNKHMQERPGKLALREITQRLDSGEWPVGSRLPPERELAAHLGISRRALREALSWLEAEGRIWRGVGRGTIVSNPATKTQPAEVNGLTSPAELMTARMALEPSIAALAAIHATARDLDHMRQYLENSTRATEHEGWDHWDSALHRSIGSSTHNMLIISLFDLLDSARTHTQWGQLRRASLTRDRLRQYTRQHRAILSAIAKRDGEQAAQCMRDHLQTVQQTLLNPLEKL